MDAVGELGTYTDPDRVPADFPLGLDYEHQLGRLFVGLPPSSKRPRSRAGELSHGAAGSSGRGDPT
jgi:hypothetical protein